jgi:hypothetical protein
MPYTISFSDPTKIEQIVIPDMPPGINSVDTSLSLVGRGYPNYGQKIAENFVKLLENFSSPIPPQNPIEGQLWYDTSDPNNKVLRIMDGSAESARWPSANGIYQQGTDPRDSATQGLKVGDIWVDTASNQLKIFNSNDWTLVGPSTAGPNQTGAIPSKIEDVVKISHDVILHIVSGRIIAITSKDQFTPRSVIEGFTILKPGINLSSASIENQIPPIFNGTAFKAQNLVDSNNQTFITDVFLRKNDQSLKGQIIEGVVRYSTPPTNTTLTGQGRDGVVINNATTWEDPSYIQFYKGDNDAIILNNTENGKIVFKIKGNSLSTVFELSPNQLSLTGNASISRQLTVASTLTITTTSTAAVNVLGGALISKNLSVTGNLNIVGISTLTGSITVSGNVSPSNDGTVNLGSQSKRYRQVYAEILGTTGSVFIGTFQGLARGLQQSTEFRITGQITGTSVLYNGTSTSATFVTQLMPESISSQTAITTSSSNLTLMVLDTNVNELRKITRDNFLTNIFPPGMITAYGSNVSAPSGWLLCDGTAYDATIYVSLYTVIGTTYGTSGGTTFKVPDMRGSTTATNASTYISYIIKT